MKIKTMRALFIDELGDTYNSEKQLVAALPKMAECATDPALAQAFSMHLNETKTHVARLEQIFDILDEDIKKEKCEATEGLVKECEQFIKHIEKGSLLDSALIAAAQKVEHYEIASYGTLRALATLMGMGQVAQILKATLDEEKAANDKLSSVANESVNGKALMESPEDRKAAA